MKYEKYLYNRQYIIGSRFPDNFQGWKKENIGELCILAHRNLEIIKKAKADTEIIILGYIFDGKNKDNDKKGIITELSLSKTFRELEDRFEYLAGRYLIIAKINDKIRIYPDAAGQRSCFYGCGWIASQPDLIAEIEKLKINRKKTGEFLSHKTANAWIGTITPYDEINMLLPNHYLDINDFKPKRFWPVDKPKEIDVNSGLKIIVEALGNIIKNASKRHKLWLAFSGGYDSRIIFTSSRDLHDKIDYFVIRDENTPAYDIEIPKKICSVYGLDFRIIDYVKPDREWLELYDRNVCKLIWGLSRKKSKTYNNFPNDIMILKGHISTVGRALYYQNGYIYKKITPKLISRFMNYKNNRIALDEIKRWFDEFPYKHNNTLTMDFALMELSLGSWQSMECLGSETNYCVFSPYNCRKIIETLLAINKKYKIYPHRLYHLMSDLTCPEIKEIPMNQESWIQSYTKKAKYLIQSLNEKLSILNS